MIMRFHESYGTLPAALLRLYRENNGSPSDHDTILAKFGHSWNDDIDVDTWKNILAFTDSSIQDGVLRLPVYL